VTAEPKLHVFGRFENASFSYTFLLFVFFWKTPLGTSSSASRHSSAPGQRGSSTHVESLQAALSACRARLSFCNIFKPAGFQHLRAGGRIMQSTLLRNKTGQAVVFK
jgi:hypothetical protein